MAEKHTDSSVAHAEDAVVITKKATKKTRKYSSSGTKQAANSKKTDSPASIPPGLRHQMIAEAAYYLAERRGFLSGYELEDWLAAESDIEVKRNS